MPRLFQLRGDACAPVLRTGDFLMVQDCDRYAYETVYLLDFGDGEGPYLAQRRLGGRPTVMIRHPNAAYTEHTVTLDQFNAAVRAIVVAEVKVKAPELLLQTALQPLALEAA
jgi:hypothetical protein